MVDLSFLEKFTKGDMSKMKRYITLYLEVVPEIFESMKKDLEIQNWDDLAISAHSLKPQVEFMGIDSLKSILIKIETKIKINDFDGIEELFGKAKNLQKESRIFLTNYYSSIK